MKSRVGLGVCEIDPHAKYYKAAGHMGKLKSHYEYIEEGRRPWLYRNGGASVIPFDHVKGYPRLCAHRGFNTILTPQEFSSSVVLGRKQILIDKSGECRRTGTVLGNAAAMTVYLHVLRTLGGAFDPEKIGGDGVSWANEAHPVASKGSEGRTFIPDEEAGTFSNLLHSALSVSTITDAQSKALSEKLARITGKTIELENRVDPACLGGVRLDYDGMRVDDTVSHRLETIGNLLKNTVL